MGRISTNTPITPAALLELQASRGMPVCGGDQEIVDHQFKAFAGGDSEQDKKKRHRLTSIIGTIGPASQEVEVIQELIKAGMNIARIEVVSDDAEQLATYVKNIKAATTKEEVPVAIALDLKGPGVRTGAIDDSGTDGRVVLKAESTVTITTDATLKDACNADTIFVDMPNIASVVKADSVIFIDDGHITLRVTTAGKDLECEVVHGGSLGSRKNVSISDYEFTGEITDKDEKDIEFAIEQEIDAIFVPYTQNAEILQKVRTLLEDKGAKTLVFAKICDLKGVQNFMAIANEADGIMVSRGLLGNSIPPEKVFVAQKMMIATANRMGRPVVCGSQMLDSMMGRGLPSRPESNDVANAVLDGSDCLLLSSQCALGENPMEAVQHMAAVCLEAEQDYTRLPVQKDVNHFSPGPIPDSVHTIALAAINATYQSMASAIVVVSNTGTTAFLLSAFKPRCPVIVVSRNEYVTRQALFYRAVIPTLITDEPLEKWDEDMNMRIKAGMDHGANLGFIKTNDTVIVVMGLSSGPGNTNCIQIIPYSP